MKGGIFQSQGYTAQQRLAMFKYICIPVRLALAVSLVFLPRSVLITGSALVVILNSVAKSEVSWSRSAHSMFAVAVGATAYFNLPPIFVSLIAISDVMYGIATHTPRLK
jgi:hypothetical protein